jgi:hypothetical protein
LFKKQNNWHNKKYTDWVKQQPSIVSGLPSDDPHHIMGHGLTGGTRAPDWAVIPLTRQEHTRFHNDPKSFEEANGSQVDLLMMFWRDNWEEIQGFFSES